MGFRNMYISASAGSGKTYQLVNRFLALLCLQKLDKGVDVSRIIAITFTRKAAGEFRGRILSALAEGALNAKAADALWHDRILPTISNEEYGILPGRDITLPGSPTDFFRNLLTDVMDQFPRLNLGTIDSLFQRMVRSLLYELGLSAYTNLPPDMEESARRKALASTCRDTANSDGLCEAILESNGNEASLSALDSYLLDLVGRYHTSALDSPPEAWGGDPATMTEAQKADFGLLPADTEETMPEDEYLETAGDVDDYVQNIWTGMTQIIQKYAQALHELKGSITKGQGGSWTSFVEKCQEYGIHLEELEEARRPLLLRKLMLRTRALRRLLDAYENHYAREVRSHGLFTFDDVPRLLAGHSDGESLARIQERTDAKLEHWLLDEFQDTAKNQYDILRDLLEARAQGDGEGSVLMVGDAKQSIYQFRGGDPRLFIQAREKLFGLNNSTEFSAEQNLSVSFRSAQSVLDLANDLFGDIDRTARCATPAARQAWKDLGYQTHESAPSVAKKLGTGYAEVRHAYKDAKGDDPDAAGNIYRNMARILLEVRSRHEYSCAILVRTGREGVKAAEALNALRAEFPFKGDIAVCDDKEVGGDSPLGQALMQLFRWLDNPADEQDLSLLKLSPLCPQEASDELAWRKLNDQLAAGGVSSVLAHLAPRLQEILKANEFLHQRWKTWVDEAAAFDAEGGTLQDWLRRIEQVTVREEPRGNPIRIMTIHKAKGLEFDVVMLPLLSSQHNMADYTKVSLLGSKNEDGSPRAVLITPPKDKGILPGMPAENLMRDWQADQEFAGFCELYVAVTRAKRATYIIHSRIDKTEEYLDPSLRDGESYKGMMLQLASLYPAPARTAKHPEGEITYAKGAPDWWAADAEEPDKDAAAQAPAEEAPEDYRFAALPRRTPSGMDSDREQPEEERTRPTAHGERRVVRLRDTGGAGFGSAVHALFEGVGWLAEGEGPQLPAHAEPRAAAVVRRALAAPAIARHFRKPAVPCRLYREQNFEALAGKSWISGQIDRLVVEYEGDKPLRAHIYDYKTDAETDPQALIATYRTQMEAYRKLVSLAFSLPSAAVSVTLLHVSAATAPEAIEVR